MKRTFLYRQVIASLIVLLLSWQGAAFAAQEQPMTVFVDVNLVPMTHDGIERGKDVLIRGERIVEIGEDLEITGKVRRIDGKNRYLMPGLAEMHGHTPVPGADPDSEFVRNMMFLYVANGVTTVRGMLGAPGQLELRRKIQEGEMLGPTLYLAGPSFNGDSIDSPAAAVARVNKQVAEGWDLLKVHPGLTRLEYDAMARTASKRGIRFGGHVPEAVGLIHALQMGQHTFDHIDGYLQHLGFPQRPLDVAELDRIAAMSKDTGAWIVPTLVLWDHVIGLGSADEMMKWPELRYWPKHQVERWYESFRARASRSDGDATREYSAARSRVLKHLSDAGVGILLGTDSPQIFSVPGFSIHREMAAMARAGLTNSDVLASGTRNVGVYLQGKDAFGVVAAGQRADLILLNANPLDNLATVANRAGVMVRGRWISEQEIKSRLNAIAR